ncbi:MAG: glycosyltransferase [Candidatus Aureabacteria bacterium]|nr:glycosyltransferase [Candidatus Auribacterota bacterium]
MRKIIVVLPIYNEAGRLPHLLEKVREVGVTLPCKIVVVAVDDGSVDESPRVIAEAAARMDVSPITHEVNKGLRDTMEDGYKEAARISGDEDVVITMDADDTQDPRYIPRMVEMLDKGYDVVIASRYQPGAVVQGVQWSRKLFSLGANLLCRTFLRIKNVRDYACGFRAFRASLVKECVRRYGDDFLEIRGFGFICAVEAIVKASALGARFAEVPFELRYDLKEGKSKMRAGRTIMGYFLLIWKSRKMRLRGRHMQQEGSDVR